MIEPRRLWLLRLICFLAVSPNVMARAASVSELPAFPGAEGFGATTPGGRGGKVLFVTNLDDNGPGSLRAACEAAGPRLVVFRVAGTIALKSPITVTTPYLTLAGQTAPGDGICVRDATFGVATHDVVIRYLRCRLGDVTGREADSLDVLHGSHDVIFDHCSATWSIDEALSLSGNNQNITIQWCLIGESLRLSKHSKGAHGYGSLARANGPVTFHHNLWIHNDARNPRLGDNYGKGPTFPTFDVRNNVIYDFGATASGLTQGNLKVNYVANYIRPGPSSTARTPITIGPNSDMQFFIRGNVFEGNEALTADNGQFFSAVELEDTARDGTRVMKRQVRTVEQPFIAPHVTTVPANDLLELVLPTVGASLPKRDAVDSRLIDHVRNRTGKLIDSQTEVGGWPELKSGEALLDSDHDGMPDAWEIKHKLAANDATDAVLDSDKDGYTNIEEYLNGTDPQVSDLAPAAVAVQPELAWPTPTRENRPWTRWWWLGSAVDKTNLTRLLTEYRNAGLGGVEICPIYGAKGYESRFLDFLSPAWMEMLAHTSGEAKRLDLGMDLTTGTGWPFGGPNVSPDIASAKVVLKKFNLAGGEQLKAGQLPAHLQCLRAISDTGEQIDLIGKVNGDRLDWTALAGKWRLYAVAQSSPVQKVKRAAPGGEGSVLDPYSVNALERYLTRFDQAFTNYSGEMPRSQFHDSFEYYGAQWTPDFLSEFANRRGYDLRTQLPALFGEGPEDTVARVKGDYRETISDLHLAYIERWTKWCHAHGSLSRDQAHGSPGNLLDIYAAADIPETEIFGSLDGQKIALNKFSSSAAHITGHNLASSESFTWLNEHFQTSLSEVKQAADYLFLSGVNHIFFHGIPYSPADAPWPGWQFYAAVNFGPQGGLWHDLPAFNAYVTRCQSILQSGTSDNDVLVYYPVHDSWHDSGDLIRPNPMSKAFTNVVATLWENGCAFDYVSDRSLAAAHSDGSYIALGRNRYRTIVVPQCRVMPETTLQKLATLARGGATICFQSNLPADVPGFGSLESRRADFRRILGEIHLGNEPDHGRAKLGAGTMLVGTNLENLMYRSGAVREPCVQAGLSFVRRKHVEGFHYYFANRSGVPFDGWVRLGTFLRSAMILDPRFENGVGVAEFATITRLKPIDGQPIELSMAEVRIQLQPGESCILRTFTNRVVTGPKWPYRQSAGTPQTLAGAWKVEFIEGGPELPASFETRELASWTKLGDAEAKRFAGTARYTIEFDSPTDKADDWLLDLARVCESARVKLNGQEVATLWCAPFQVSVGKFLRPGKNTLQIEVTNLAANRIADLDRRKVNWKYFYDINMASKRYRSLDASDWPLRDSGLLGPVTLWPMKAF